MTDKENKTTTNKAVSLLNIYIKEQKNIYKKCFFWERKKKSRAKINAKHYESLLNELGDNPTLFDVAFKLPDGLLEKMGF